MLRARHSQAVTGNDHHALGIGQDISRVICATAFDRALLLRTSNCRTGFGAKAAQDHAEEGAVHRLTHDVTQNRARASHQRASKDQHAVVQREANARCSPARVAVEHGHDHRHISTANRDDDQHAHDKRQEQHGQKGGPVLSRDTHQAQADRCQAQHQIEHVLARETHRRTLEQAEFVFARQLTKRNHGATEGDRTNRSTQEQLQAVARRNGKTAHHFSNHQTCRGLNA